MTIHVGDQVCWVHEQQQLLTHSSHRIEFLTVQRVHANGRCDLKDARGAELFNIRTEHLVVMREKSRLR